MNNDRHQPLCDRCAGPRSKESKSLCKQCHRSGLHPKCIHYWVYETPNGPTSIGVCRVCGERSMGINSPYIKHGRPELITLDKRKRSAPHGIAR